MRGQGNESNKGSNEDSKNEGADGTWSIESVSNNRVVEERSGCEMMARVYQTKEEDVLYCIVLFFLRR